MERGRGRRSVGCSRRRTNSSGALPKFGAQLPQCLTAPRQPAWPITRGLEAPPPRRQRASGHAWVWAQPIGSPLSALDELGAAHDFGKGALEGVRHTPARKQAPAACRAASPLCSARRARTGEVGDAREETHSHCPLRVHSQSVLAGSWLWLCVFAPRDCSGQTDDVVPRTCVHLLCSSCTAGPGTTLLERVHVGCTRTGCTV